MLIATSLDYIRPLCQKNSYLSGAGCGHQPTLCIGCGRGTGRKAQTTADTHLQKKVMNKKGVGRKNGCWVLSGATDEGTCYVDAETDVDSVLFSPSNKRSQYSRAE